MKILEILEMLKIKLIMTVFFVLLFATLFAAVTTAWLTGLAMRMFSASPEIIEITISLVAPMGGLLMFMALAAVISIEWFDRT